VRLPRDVDFADLASLLREHFGYEWVRQNGSHQRYVTTRGGKHSVTIPAHNPIAIGTLADILSDVGSHFGLNRSAVADRLFGH